MKKLLALTLVLLAQAAFATVPDPTSYAGPYACDGVQTAYSFPYRFFNNSDLLVYKTSATGVQTTLVYAGDYSVSNTGTTSGGTVTLTAGATCAATYTLTIKRVVPLTQITSWRSQGTFSPALLENSLDKLTMSVQQLEREKQTDAQVKASIVNAGNIVVSTKPTATTLGGLYSSTCAAGTYASGINTNGTITCAPAFIQSDNPTSNSTITGVAIGALSLPLGSVTGLTKNFQCILPFTQSGTTWAPQVAVQVGSGSVSSLVYTVETPTATTTSQIYNATAASTYSTATASLTAGIVKITGYTVVSGGSPSGYIYFKSSSAGNSVTFLAGASCTTY